jgi:hypothetical protein
MENLLIISLIFLPLYGLAQSKLESNWSIPDTIDLGVISMKDSLPQNFKGEYLSVKINVPLTYNLVGTDSIFFYRIYVNRSNSYIPQPNGTLRKSGATSFWLILYLPSQYSLKSKTNITVHTNLGRKVCSINYSIIGNEKPVLKDTLDKTLFQHNYGSRAVIKIIPNSVYFFFNNDNKKKIESILKRYPVKSFEIEDERKNYSIYGNKGMLTFNESYNLKESKIFTELRKLCEVVGIPSINGIKIYSNTLTVTPSGIGQRIMEDLYDFRKDFTYQESGSGYYQLTFPDSYGTRMFDVADSLFTHRAIRYVGSNPQQYYELYMDRSNLRINEELIKIEKND